MPAARAMLGQQHKRHSGREMRAHRRHHMQEQAMLGHQSHKGLEVQAMPGRLRDRHQRPHRVPASDGLQTASLGSTRRERAHPRTSRGRARCTDRRIVHWDRRDMLGWGRGVGVAGQHMGPGRAPRWSWPRWRVRSRANCDVCHWYRCLLRQCGG